MKKNPLNQLRLSLCRNWKESGSILSRIEKYAFNGTGLVEIILPASVEMLGESCFYDCGSLSSVTFLITVEIVTNWKARIQWNWFD
jgi:hypothetical protein